MPLMTDWADSDVDINFPMSLVRHEVVTSAVTTNCFMTCTSRLDFIEISVIGDF